MADILTAIDEAGELLRGVTREDLVRDRFRRLALERVLEILSEASRHIPPKIRETVALPWRDISDLGNLLRHAYHRVDPEVLWHIAKDDLPLLRSPIIELMKQIDSQA